MSAAPSVAESPYAWLRLAASLAVMTLSGVGMYAVAVALPAVQAEFGIDRSGASLPYAATMIGFGLGGILMGRLADRFGVMVPVLVGAAGLGLGFVAAGNAASLWQFVLAQGLLIGLLGTSAGFAPLVADTSLWFTRRRGIAVAICASGNYLAGAAWPTALQHYFDTIGWRATFTGVGIFCFATIVPLAFVLKRRPPSLNLQETRHLEARSVAIPQTTLLLLLCVAGVACCVAMSMPQVHIVAYCGDLGFPAARGAEMLSVMLGFGIVSRLASGWICDRIGGLRTLLLGSGLQGVALLLFLPFDSLVSLYVVSALFGLFQGGIVPSYAIIVREYFPPSAAGANVGLIIMCTLLGMALGGWMSGAVFDLTGSYRAAFLNGIGWNLLNLSIAFYLLRKSLADQGLQLRGKLQA
ncbi:MAG TPA: MFS transporter [Burkholderiales bacterium]|nr:MFS transporter [Burkholderiales bacterium]